MGLPASISPKMQPNDLASSRGTKRRFDGRLAGGGAQAPAKASLMTTLAVKRTSPTALRVVATAALRACVLAPQIDSLAVLVRAKQDLWRSVPASRHVVGKYLHGAKHWLGIGGGAVRHSEQRSSFRRPSRQPHAAVTALVSHPSQPDAQAIGWQVVRPFVGFASTLDRAH
eukprot:6175420-Pleurochrysis_carterae.AAC.3